MESRSFNYKEIIKYVIVFVVGFILLQLITMTNMELSKAIERIDTEKMVVPYLFRSLCGIFFGFLIKWRAFLKLFRGNAGVNAKLFPGILLALISLTPHFYLARLFRLSGPFTFSTIQDIFSYEFSSVINMLFVSPVVFGGGAVIMVLSVSAGLLIVEGLYKNAQPPR